MAIVKRRIRRYMSIRDYGKIRWTEIRKQCNFIPISNLQKFSNFLLRIILKLRLKRFG